MTTTTKQLDEETATLAPAVEAEAEPHGPRGQETEERAKQAVVRDRRIEQLREEIGKRDRRQKANGLLITALLAVALVAAYYYRQVLFTEENFVLVFMGLGAFLYLSVQIWTSGETDTTSLQADLDKLVIEAEVAERLGARAAALPSESALTYFRQSGRDECGQSARIL